MPTTTVTAMAGEEDFVDHGISFLKACRSRRTTGRQAEWNLTPQSRRKGCAAGTSSSGPDGVGVEPTIVLHGVGDEPTGRFIPTLNRPIRGPSRRTGKRLLAWFELGQGVGICRRTVAVTGRDAAGYTTTLKSGAPTWTRTTTPLPSHGEMQHSHTLGAWRPWSDLHRLGPA